MVGVVCVSPKACTIYICVCTVRKDAYIQYEELMQFSCGYLCGSNSMYLKDRCCHVSLQSTIVGGDRGDFTVVSSHIDV